MESIERDNRSLKYIASQKDAYEREAKELKKEMARLVQEMLTLLTDSLVEGECLKQQTGALEAENTTLKRENVAL
jgi:hypothetical protein